jgi:F-type H+-transporting ATPase subunit gamma
MANLKDLKRRIDSVQATQKITSAMKMVAASKLRRAQEAAESARPYADRMDGVVRRLAERATRAEGAPALLVGKGQEATRLLLVATSDRGLCGGFNTSIVREAKRVIGDLLRDGATVKILCVGRKGNDMLKREYGGLIVDTIEDVGRKRLQFTEAAGIADRLTRMFEEEEFDAADIIYSRFQSALSQVVTRQRIVPFLDSEEPGADETGAEASPRADEAIYEFEPEQEELLGELLPRNLAVQIYRALLESAASEQGARMTAMDNATRNAGEMIDKLTLHYNRTRQAVITKELIEIVSGAEAL